MAAKSAIVVGEKKTNKITTYCFSKPWANAIVTYIKPIKMSSQKESADTESTKMPVQQISQLIRIIFGHRRQVMHCRIRQGVIARIQRRPCRAQGLKAIDRFK